MYNSTNYILKEKLVAIFLELFQDCEDITSGFSKEIINGVQMYLKWGDDRGFFIGPSRRKSK
jgi:hypothetical protein